MAVPNLDAMNQDELRAFAQYVHGFSRKKARILFGDPLPPGHRQAFNKLGHYAWNLITARAERERGHIGSAQMYEAIVDRVYQQLPPWARW
jgi:hypothetical protein